MFLLNEQISRDDLKKHMKELYNYCVQHLKGIDRNPKVFLKSDSSNAEDIFGKTGFYNPDTEEIYLFVSDRHPKDVLRSFAHELVHHDQNCRGDTSSLNMDLTSKDPAYASHDEGLREMEREAFEVGNLLFRDWCDMKKIQRRGENIMSESKTAVDVLLERVTGRLIAESKDGYKKMVAKEKAKPKPGKSAKSKEKLDPVGQEDDDIDNDGDKDSTDKYLKNKRKAIGTAIKKTKKEALQEGLKEKTNESLDELNPYPQLFNKKERLFQDRMSKHEELLYQEMLKLAIKK